MMPPICPIIVRLPPPYAGADEQEWEEYWQNVDREKKLVRKTRRVAVGSIVAVTVVLIFIAILVPVYFPQLVGK